MAKPNAIVSTIVELAPRFEPGATPELRAGESRTLTLEGGRVVKLDPSDSRATGFAEILSTLQSRGLPVYLELLPSTGAIGRLLIPHVTRVLRVQPLENGALSVDLYYSSGRHFLRRDQESFAEYEALLRAAAESGQVLTITEDDSHDVIDVRPFVPGAVKPDLPFDEEKLEWPPGPVEIHPIWPPFPWLRGCISAERAQQVFNAMSATNCNPIAVPPPCIPFLYPDDGCWGRAHEMCRLMIAMGLSPEKVWIQGQLTVKTRNNPNCQVQWGWHVAPTLCVRGPYFWQTQTMVIDPSLFTTPVTEATWKGVQGDPNATLTPSDASIFYLWGNETDPTYAKTNQVLATYRLALKNRSLQVGPPPYANCP
jgi:hypothetical protein